MSNAPYCKGVVFDFIELFPFDTESYIHDTPYLFPLDNNRQRHPPNTPPINLCDIDLDDLRSRRNCRRRIDSDPDQRDRYHR